MVFDKCELELAPVLIGEKRLELYSVKRWDVIENNPYETEEEYIENFPLWIKIWDASIVLASHLVKTDMDKGSDILELGAGMGLAGLSLGTLGYHVIITDFNDDALALLQKNIVHNELKTVGVKKLDWHHPEIEGTFDAIIGSELIYKENDIDPVIRFVRHHIKPDGVFYVAHDIQRKSMVKFIEKASCAFKIKTWVKTLNKEGEPQKVLVHALTGT